MVPLLWAILHIPSPKLMRSPWWLRALQERRPCVSLGTNWMPRNWQVMCAPFTRHSKDMIPSPSEGAATISQSNTARHIIQCIQDEVRPVRGEVASASGVYEPALWVGRVSPSIEHRQFSVGNIYFGFGSGLFCGGLLSGGLCTHFRVLGILFILVCLPFGLRHSTLLSQVTDLSTYPAGLVRNPIGVILSAFAGVILRCEGFGVCKDFEFGPKFQACGSCLFLSRGDVLAEGLEVPVSFVRQR